VAIDTHRVDWQRAYREIEAATPPRRQRNLLVALDAVTDELRRRVGQTFTLAQLVRAYSDVERWGREAVGERAPYDGWTRDLALVEDAAFHLYARGAVDYEP
jgi:hypothetical protein